MTSLSGTGSREPYPEFRLGSVAGTVPGGRIVYQVAGCGQLSRRAWQEGLAGVIVQGQKVETGDRCWVASIGPGGGCRLQVGGSGQEDW